MPNFFKNGTFALTEEFRANDRASNHCLRSDRVPDEAHALDEKRSLLAPTLSAVQGADRDHRWVLNARDIRARADLQVI